METRQDVVRGGSSMSTSASKGAKENQQKKERLNYKKTISFLLASFPFLSFYFNLPFLAPSLFLLSLLQRSVHFLACH